MQFDLFASQTDKYIEHIRNAHERHQMALHCHCYWRTQRAAGLAEDVLLTFISQTGSPRFVCSTGIIHNKSIISFPLQSGQHCSRLNAGLPMPWPMSSFTSAGAIICPSALAAALRFAACHYSPMLTIRIVAKSNLWNGFDFLVELIQAGTIDTLTKETNKSVLISHQQLT